MTVDLRVLLAHMMLNIWNPLIWSAHPDKRRQRQLQLAYRARGVVNHDRALNGEME